jgi:hypothetical protein
VVGLSAWLILVCVLPGVLPLDTRRGRAVWLLRAV